MTALAAPPTAPGSLTAPPRSAAVLEFLDALRRWRDDLNGALNALDRRAQVASTPDTFTADLELAMSLWESINQRTDDLVKAWDSGRVGPAELATIAELTWGRLPDPLGNPSAFSLPEATTLASALEARLAARLDADTIAGSGAADRIGPLRETLARARDLAETLGTAPDHLPGEADRLAADLDNALAGSSGPTALGAAIGRIADAAEVLERDLIKEASRRSTAQASAAELAARLTALGPVEARVREVAALCRDKIAGAPRLGVPEVSRLGPVPGVPAGSHDSAAWATAHAALAAYRSRLDQVTAALAEAERRFTAPLTERAELRGLAEAYQARASAAGLAEDSQLYKGFDALRAVLWHAPCDLAAARPLVESYVDAVQHAVGAYRPRPDATPAPATPAPAAETAPRPDAVHTEETP